MKSLALRFALLSVLAASVAAPAAASPDVVTPSLSGPVVLLAPLPGGAFVDVLVQEEPGQEAALSPPSKGQWPSILPPLVAILFALVFRRTIPALFLGLFLGAWLAHGFSFSGGWLGLLDSFQVYVRNALADGDRASIILFTLMIGGMVGIVSKSGGMQGVVKHISRLATSARRGQLATSLLGVIIFFDDYANTLVVGNTMRPVTDRLRISREKLSYVVDSTAAPVACIALVTTWIGYEVGLIGESIESLAGFSDSAYGVFLSSIPYSFYPILALAFVFMVALTGRDFGPMYKAEVRARTTGALMAPGAKIDDAAVGSPHFEPNPTKPTRSINAVAPVLVLVFGVLYYLYDTGSGDSLREIIGNADSYKALMYASLLGMLTAAGLALFQRILTVEEIVESWYAGVKSVFFSLIILVLAWSLSDVTKVLGTADFLVSVLGDTLLPAVLPALVFFLAAATAFATGSSWGAMGILMPLVVPLAWAILVRNGMADPSNYHILYSSVSCVLAGAVWGDHCSPISDTTILSSLASGSDHIDHVRTQLPYAALVGTVGIALGTLPVGFGMPWWVGILAGLLVLAIVLRFVGKSVDDKDAAAYALA